MINKGIVTKVNGDMLTVIFERHEACGDCHACMHGSTSCAKHTVQIRGKAEVGDEVVVEMDDSRVMEASATAYLIPFAGMMLGFLLFLFLAGVPCAHTEKAQHIHAVDLAHTPAAFQKRIVCIHDEIVQRQPGFVMSVCAAFVGNSLRTPVVWVCTAMSASAMSCISLSTG